MNTVSELTKLWKADKESFPEFKSECSFRIDGVVEDIEESPSESEKEYSFKIDIVEDSEEESPESKN